MTLTPRQVFACFKRRLNEVVREFGVAPLMGLPADGFDEDAPVDLLISNNIDPSVFVASISWDDVRARVEAHAGAGHPDGRRVVVAPCSPLFEPILEQLAAAYPHALFVDTNRADTAIGGHTIVHPDAADPRPDDLCLILTRNVEACECYRRQFGADNCVDWLAAYVQAQMRDAASGTDAFINTLNAAAKPILFVSARPMATLNSTIRSMQRDGFSTFWLGSEEVKEAHQTGYATPRVADVALDGFSIGGLIDFIHVFAHMQRGVALYHYETIYPPAWDFRRVAICYAGTLAVIRTVKECRPEGYAGRLGLYMYDAVKPGVKNYPCGDICGPLYKAMVAEAEALVYSSFTDDFGDFVENAVGKPLPRVHHHRYQTLPTARRPRLTDGYHIAVISVLLEDFWEPSRMGLIPYVRNILDQGIHIHYYVANNSRGKAAMFEDTLTEAQRPFFHLHTPIHDLEALANELSAYHAGWSLFNMQIFDEMVAHLTDQFTRDAMDMFTPTTLPSVIWSCAAAGLPIICNRSMRAVVDLLPPGMAIPLTLSEVHRLHAVLDAVDWDAVDRTSLAGLDIDHHIHKLYRFLEGYYA